MPNFVKGIIFFFYSLEHAPLHVHVRGNDLKRIEQTIEENADIIAKRWNELFDINNAKDQ
ncbi:MAG: DUF4160 domain-containing protein [Bacteroidales bacterium]|nr:DUF4160 domain-containing protein [Bacteroidales bacterium]